jgi:hypothetical protein
MAGSVNTNLPDGDDERETGNNARIVAIVAVLVAPLVVLSAVGTWLLFSIGRIRRSVIALGLLAYSLLALIFIVPILHLYIDAWTKTLPGIFNGEIAPVAGVLLFIAQQAPISLPIGCAIGLIYASWRWFTRPMWEESNFRLTPWEIRAGRKNRRDISLDQNGPMTGATIGVNPQGKKIVQTDKEAAGHTIILGGVGTGKTTTMMGKARDIIRQGSGLIFVDLKGGEDVPALLAMYAERHNRKFRHWLMQPQTEKYDGPAKDGPSFYDPLARGEATRRKDLLIASRDWGANADIYKIKASDYLQVLFNVLIGREELDAKMGTPKKQISTFAEVVTLLNPARLKDRAIPLGRDPRYALMVQQIDEMNDTKLNKTTSEAIDGLRSQMNTLLQSVAGHWLQVDPKRQNDIDLFRAAHEGEIIVFSLDSSNYQELSSLVANLIIQDLKTVTSELRRSPVQNPVQVFIDEFSAIGSDNLTGLINKSRDANMPVTFSTQALGDLRKIDPTFLDQILGIVGAFVIHRANTLEDAEVFAGLIGTEKRKKFRQSVEHESTFLGIGRGRGSGKGMVEDVDDFRVGMQEIQDLEVGNNIYLSKITGRLERVQVIQEEGVSTSNFRKPELVMNEERIREAHMANSLPDLRGLFAPEDDEDEGTGPLSDEEAEALINRYAAPPKFESKAVESNPVPAPAEPRMPSMNLNLNGGLSRPRPAAPVVPTTPTLIDPAEMMRDELEMPGTPVSKPRPATPAFPAAPAFPGRPVRKTEPVVVPKPVKRVPVPAPQPVVEPVSEGELLQPITPKPPKRKDAMEF